MKNLFKVSSVIVLLFIVLSSCKKDAVAPVSKITTAAQTFLNLPYGNHALQTMDVYLPANRTAQTSTVVFVHGGSFVEGDKSDFTTLVKELVRRDFAVLNVNYRLVDATGLYNNPPRHLESAVKIKDQVQDMSAIIDFTIAHAKEWQVSDSKIAMAGHSAGATLALLYTYDARNANKVKVVANLAGALDQTFTDLPYYLLSANVLEGGYRYTGYAVNINNDQYYREISPLYVANADRKIPTLNVFPELNSVAGLPKQGRSTFDAFTAKLNSLNIPNKFVLVPGADHEFSKFGNFDTVLNETVAYFNANLK